MSHETQELNLGYAPRSRLYQGFFGRMFRNLPPYEPPGSTDQERQDFLIAIGEKMTEAACGKDLDNQNIPAGYTYFGQLIDHDITFDPVSSLERQNDPHMLANFRTPRFDLDNLYGRGPDDNPFLYDKSSPGKLLIGKGQDPNTGNPTNEDDLPRNIQSVALIGDMRNDENIIVSQLQLAFLKFHNAMIDHLAASQGLSGAALFHEAQRLVRWHYQYAVIHDFLKRVIGPDRLGKLLPDAEKCCKEPNLCFYQYRNNPFMPVEFSVAAYRFGHSMVRPSYELNDTLTGFTNGPLPIFDSSLPPDSLGHLGGFRGRPLPPFWTIQWNRFLQFPGEPAPQFSRKIDPCLADPLNSLPKNVVSASPSSSLAARNLLRGFRMGLPSGQSVARTLCECNCDDLQDPLADLAGKPIPLFRYILLEAAYSGDCGGNGVILGEVGGTIVGEVFMGLLAGDPHAYLNVEPCWTPMREGIVVGPMATEFTLADIIKFAGMPITHAEVEQIVNG